MIGEIIGQRRDKRYNRRDNMTDKRSDKPYQSDKQLNIGTPNERKSDYSRKLTAQPYLWIEIVVAKIGKNAK